MALAQDYAGNEEKKEKNMSTATKDIEELLMIKEITGVCPLIILMNRQEYDGQRLIEL